MVESGGYQLAWVGYAGDDNDRTVQPVASAGRGASDLDNIHIHWGDDARGDNPTGAAIRSGTPQVARGANAGDNCPLWTASLAQRGHLSSIALPLRDAGKTFGLLHLCAQEVNAFDDAEVYEFMDVSQVNSRTFNEDHWTNVFWINRQNRRFPRPLNNTKIYSDGQLNFGTGTPVDVDVEVLDSLGNVLPFAVSTWSINGIM